MVISVISVLSVAVLDPSPIFLQFVSVSVEVLYVLSVISIILIVALDLSVNFLP